MLPYGDPEAIRAMGRRLAARAQEMRDDARHVERVVGGVPWHGVAAGAMSAVTRERVTTLLGTAAHYDDAAAALAHHAATVTQRMELIASIERRALALVGEAERRVRDFHAGLVDALDPRDELLAAFSAPAHGSVAWLGVHLPGL